MNVLQQLLWKYEDSLRTDSASTQGGKHMGINETIRRWKPINSLPDYANKSCAAGARN